MQNEVEEVQATIRKAQGEHEKKIAPEVKTDNEKSSPYIRNVRSGGRWLHPLQDGAKAIY